MRGLFLLALIALSTTNVRAADDSTYIKCQASGPGKYTRADGQIEVQNFTLVDTYKFSDARNELQSFDEDLGSFVTIENISNVSIDATVVSAEGRTRNDAYWQAKSIKIWRNSGKYEYTSLLGGNDGGGHSELYAEGSCNKIKKPASKPKKF